MNEILKQHPLLPKNGSLLVTHSQFGNLVGYTHCQDAASEAKGLFYVALQLTAEHAGAPGRGHGAVNMAILDEAMGRAASRTLNQLCYTASMTTNFCTGTKIGDILVAEAKVTRSGKNIVFINAELHAMDRLIATATGTWVNSKRPIPTTK